MVLALSDVVRYLVFPLAVLIAGALVTSFLIPRLAERRARHQKALEVQTDLVREISDTVLKFVMAMEFAVLGHTSQDRNTYDDAYRTWEVKTGVLHAMLEAYFPGTDLVRDWESLEAHLRAAHVITEAAPEEARVSWESMKGTGLDMKKKLNEKVLNTRVAGWDG